MVFLEHTAATERGSVRFIRGAKEEAPMHHAATYYHPHIRRQPTLADYIVDPLIWGIRRMAQVIEDSVNKVIVAISVVVISAIIIGVGGMAVYAFFGVEDIRSHIQSIDRHIEAIDARDRGNNGRSGP